MRIALFIFLLTSININNNTLAYSPLRIAFVSFVLKDIINYSTMNASRFSSLLRQSLQCTGRRVIPRPSTLPAMDTVASSWRYKHSGAKMGQHLERLDELAHEQSQKKAQERRQKKKARKAETTSEAAAVEQPEEELYQEEEEQLAEEEQNFLPDPKQTKLKMKQIVQRFIDSLKNMRGAEPTVALFDNVQVEAYGARTSLQSVAQVVLVSPTLATATCFDPSLAKAVRTAVAQQLNLNPSAEDGVVNIPLPRISLESRQKIAMTLAKRAESYRQGIRQVRRKAMDVTKKGVAGKLEHVSKDDAFRVQQEVEAATEEAIHELNRAAEEKHNSIMAVE
jgi:ribosome recycling factor